MIVDGPAFDVFVYTTSDGDGNLAGSFGVLLSAAGGDGHALVGAPDSVSPDGVPDSAVFVPPLLHAAIATIATRPIPIRPLMLLPLPLSGLIDGRKRGR